MGRPLARRRVHAPPIITPQDVAAQDGQAGDDALREPANSIAGRTRSTRHPTGHRAVDGAPYPPLPPPRRWQRRAVDWFAGRGVTIERVLSENGSAYRSLLWRDTCEALSIRPRFTRPYRPQTNGKVERFHRTMADGWAYARCYPSETERRDAHVAWLHQYNQQRPHAACGNERPFSRLTNAPVSTAWGSVLRRR